MDHRTFFAFPNSLSEGKERESFSSFEGKETWERKQGNTLVYLLLCLSPYSNNIQRKNKVKCNYK